MCSHQSCSWCLYDFEGWRKADRRCSAMDKVGITLAKVQADWFIKYSACSGKMALSMLWVSAVEHGERIMARRVRMQSNTRIILFSGSLLDPLKWLNSSKSNIFRKSSVFNPLSNQNYRLLAKFILGSKPLGCWGRLGYDRSDKLPSAIDGNFRGNILFLYYINNKQRIKLRKS